MICAVRPTFIKSPPGHNITVLIIQLYISFAMLKLKFGESFLWTENCIFLTGYCTKTQNNLKRRWTTFTWLKKATPTKNTKLHFDTFFIEKFLLFQKQKCSCNLGRNSISQLKVKVV